MTMLFSTILIGVIVKKFCTGKSKEVTDWIMKWSIIVDVCFVRWSRDYLFGCHLDHIFRADYGYTTKKSSAEVEAGEEGYEQVNERYFSEYEPKGCKSAFFNDIYDCPICLNPIEDG